VPRGRATASDAALPAQDPEDEPRLAQRTHELVHMHPRYGYQRIWALLQSEGWLVNGKRSRRLWKCEGFKVPQKQRKRRRLGSRIAVLPRSARLDVRACPPTRLLRDIAASRQ
jgi:hypothetical protein